MMRVSAAGVWQSITDNLACVSVSPQRLLGQRAHQELEQRGVKSVRNGVLCVRKIPERREGGLYSLHELNVYSIHRQHSAKNITKHDQAC